MKKPETITLTDLPDSVRQMHADMMSDVTYPDLLSLFELSKRQGEARSDSVRIGCYIPPNADGSKFLIRPYDYGIGLTPAALYQTMGVTRALDGGDYRTIISVPNNTVTQRNFLLEMSGLREVASGNLRPITDQFRRVIEPEVKDADSVIVWGSSQGGAVAPTVARDIEAVTAAVAIDPSNTHESRGGLGLLQDLGKAGMDQVARAVNDSDDPVLTRSMRHDITPVGQRATLLKVALRGMMPSNIALGLAQRGDNHLIELLGLSETAHSPLAFVARQAGSVVFGADDFKNICEAVNLSGAYVLDNGLEESYGHAGCNSLLLNMALAERVGETI